MKHLILFALLAGVALVATAQTNTAGSDAVRIHGYQDGFVLPAKPFRMFPSDFDGVKGKYDLSNGGVLVLVQKGKRLFAEVNDGAPKELVAAAHNVFVSTDRDVQITLDLQSFGGVSGEMWMMKQDRQAQERRVQSHRLVGVQ